MSTFCPIPWIFQAARNNGDLRVCCQANSSPNRGILRNSNNTPINAKDGRLQDARNNEMLKQMRRKMLNEAWPEECIRCKNEENSGLRSRRQYETKSWNFTKQNALNVTSADGTIDTENCPVIYYDLRFGNRCNMACRMCGPEDSDRWYHDYVKMNGKTYFHDSHGKVDLVEKSGRWMEKANSYNWYDSDKFWADLEANKSSIQHIYMAGGEPLLIKKHYEFLEKCVNQRISKNIVLEYNTNMTILPEKALELWKSFKQVRIGASIDGVGHFFEVQRYPSKWSDIYNNLKALDQTDSNIVAWLACTVTVYNIIHLPDFILWKLNQSGFKKINSSNHRPIFTHHMAHRPAHLNVKSLTEKQKNTVKAKFDNFRKAQKKLMDPHLYDAGLKILDGVERYMFSENLSDRNNQKMIEFSKSLDELRGQDSLSLLP